ncbi:hypothetical protein GCM10012275_49310 [Longimycelium tulufanense]|uniref:Tetratricopeptide repeat protein n=1 Tax=Longimycelium tulufanense TaxID=907463 RepID=A0A8J3FY28_9PSEU|nr:tetratricopeptide repeat protein [Longimycelium tulufanense]GGM72802.1 hypothetical protein GCM10012275_49310 [Longimycelium tulufanense]
MAGIDGVLLRAAELTAAGRQAEAVRLLRPLVRAHPDNPTAWCHLAAALLDGERHEPALSAARRAAVLDADRDWPHRLASIALVELGRPAEAVLSARESVRLAPGEWRSHVALAEALVADAPNGGEEAAAAARRAVALAPHEARTHEVLGDVELTAHRLDEAEAAYRAARRIDPRSEHARANLALIARLRAGEPSPAFEPAAHRTVTRLALVQGAGALVLLYAGYPVPHRGLASIGLLLCLAVAAGIAVFTRKIPLAAWPGISRLLARRAVLGLAVLFLVTGFGFLLAWSLTLVMGPATVQPVALAWLATMLALGLTFLVRGSRNRGGRAAP